MSNNPIFRLHAIFYDQKAFLFEHFKIASMFKEKLFGRFT